MCNYKTGFGLSDDHECKVMLVIVYCLLRDLCQPIQVAHLYTMFIDTKIPVIPVTWGEVRVPGSE